jgi:hypothetical protein
MTTMTISTMRMKARTMTTAKFGRHQTIYTGALKREIETIQGLPGVSRVIIGRSRGTRHHQPVGSIHVQSDLPTGIKIVGFSDRGVTEFYVITSDIVNVRMMLNSRYEEDED